MNKPKYLYHASPNQNISIIKPSNKSIRNTEEGPVVFALKDKMASTTFLVPTTDDWVLIGSFKSNEEVVRYVLISDREKFKSFDKGGAIYKVPSDTFSVDKRYSSDDEEWTSILPVTPLSKDTYCSGLDAMIKAGISVYFTDTETFKRIKASTDQGYDIIKNLTPEL